MEMADEILSRNQEKSGMAKAKVEEALTAVGPTTDAEQQESPPPVPVDVEEPPPEYVPDGGKEAWTVVLGSSLALFASAGMINAYVRIL